MHKGQMNKAQQATIAITNCYLVHRRDMTFKVLIRTIRSYKLFSQSINFIRT